MPAAYRIIAGVSGVTGSVHALRYAATWSFCSTVVTGGCMTSATVAGGGAGCCAGASAMICSCGDLVTVLGIRSHRSAEAMRSVEAVAGVRQLTAVPIWPPGLGLA
jgi:hypothetical protein